MIRDDMQSRMVPGALVNSSMASDAEVEAFIKLERQTRDLRYLPIPAPAAALAAPTAAEVEAWYKKTRLVIAMMKPSRLNMSKQRRQLP